MKALVLGATGLVGRHTLIQLLNRDEFTQVYAVSRSGLDIQHHKLIQIKADFDSIAKLLDDIEVDHFFSCLGTTKKKTPNEKDYYQLEHDYPILVAKRLQEKGCNTLCFVSAIGADASSRIFYRRMKGETERDLHELGYRSTLLFRPSLITGQRNEARFLEDLSSKVFKWINPLLKGALSKYQSVDGEAIASAMITAALASKEGTYYFTTDDIKELA